MTRPLALLALIAALPTPALSQGQKYEITSRRESVVGDAVRRTRRMSYVSKRKVTDQGKVVVDETKKIGTEVTQTDEVKEAAEGELVRGRRVYERYFDQEAKKEVPLKGLVVDHVRAADRTYSWVRVEGPEVPEFLSRELQGECQRLTRAAQDRATAKVENRDPLLPLEPVAVGERWTVPLERACQGLGLAPEDVNADSVKVSGVLEQVEPEGEWRRVKITASLTLKTLFGRAVKAGRWSAEIHQRLRPNDIEGSYRSRGTVSANYLDGPTGRLVEVEQTWEQADDRVVIDPESGR